MDSIIGTKGLRGVILKPMARERSKPSMVLTKMRHAVEQGILVLNVTQCHAGSVDMEKYEIPKIKAGRRCKR